MSKDLDAGDYVLGTEDDELRRLGLQHAVWRPRASDAWRRAGFTAGQHILDIGCGPGYATFDLSDIVGPSGHITGLERSPRFLEHLQKRLAAEPHRHVDVVDIDLDSPNFPALSADGAWCRWVFAFVQKPRELLQKIRGSLVPGASLVIHEYFDYRMWSLIPREPDFEEFVAAVMTSWRANGGETNIAVDLLPWLPTEGFRVADVKPLVEVVSPQDFFWQWPRAFVGTGVQRLVDLGFLTSEKGELATEAFQRAEANPHARVVTPGVLEIIATAE
ncbi:MAG: class I SAM-dependent methyltransferase [Gemmatimonadales bacterium]